QSERPRIGRVYPDPIWRSVETVDGHLVRQVAREHAQIEFADRDAHPATDQDETVELLVEGVEIVEAEGAATAITDVALEIEPHIVAQVGLVPSLRRRGPLRNAWQPVPGKPDRAGLHDVCGEILRQL